MSEVQKTADRVGIIRDGVMVSIDDVEGLRASSVRNVEIVFAEPVPAAQFAALDGVKDLTVTGEVLRCRLDGSADALVKAAATHTVLSLTSEEPDLEEVFFHRYANGPDARGTSGAAS
jgi:ABC-2 type transport system ATP-binding protein